MPRRSGGASELREMLAAHSRERRERWDAAALRRWEALPAVFRSPEPPTPLGGQDREAALLAGDDVSVSAGELFRTLCWAGRDQEAKRYRFDGPDFRTSFTLVGERLEVIRLDLRPNV